MGSIFGGLALGVVAVVAILFARAQKGKTDDGAVAMRYGGYLVTALASMGALLLLFASSFTHVGGDEIGHLDRVYFGKLMPPGQVIALPGEQGPQAKTFSPGFHFVPLLKVIYHVKNLKEFVVPEDQYGFVVASDGLPLRHDQFLADQWPEERFQQMLEAEYFLRNGGQKGAQLTVLPPGTYRFNHHLFKVVPLPAKNVPAGMVAVVKSNVQEGARDCTPVKVVRSAEALHVPLVPKGCIGIWNEALPQGRYYLNHRAYEVTDISIRAEAWEYKGGYVRRYIDLHVDQEGKVTQTERTENIPVPPDAADPAVSVRVEGWIVPLEMRVIAQVAPEDAPFVVASVGGLQEVEDKILTPTIRSVVRNVAAGTPDKDGKLTRTVLDLQNKRAELESLVEQEIQPEGNKAGVSIKEVRFGDPIIPPELLVALVRNQLAVQLQATYREEKEAQNQRVESEKSRATADQQPKLVAAQIAVKVATEQVEVEKQNKIAAKLRGEGREAELTAISKGQKEQVSVLGQDRVLQLEALMKVLDAAVANPNIVKVPQVLVEGGDGSGLAGFAAILGWSNIAKGMILDETAKK